jgi:type IV pilus assembly protein PilC
MPAYQYTALNEKGKKIRGQITAVNEADLDKRLRSIHLDVIDSRVVVPSKIIFFERIKIQDLIVFCIHLEQLERAGVPILEAIADLRDTADSPYMKSIMADIYERVQGGELLSGALAKHPRVFDSVFVSLVQAGEKTGNLHEVFHHLTRHLKWVGHIQSRIKKATYYPIFLLILMSGILTLMMMFVIPKLSSFLTSQNFELPWYTKALIAFSHAFTNYWYLILCGPLLIIATVMVLKRTVPGVAYALDRFKLAIPYIGTTIYKIELARFCHFFGIMYRSGIGILECLGSASQVVANRVIQESIMNVKNSVAEGNSLTLSLKASNQFPSLVVRMFKVGEESGSLDDTLENINFFYDREVEDSVNNMVGIIQPALTIVMGGLMLWISMAVFGPLYSSFSNMKF